jgi:hypothetical protein
VQPELQHTPSAQKPLAHSRQPEIAQSLAPQVWPSVRCGTHTPFALHQ